ncbi:hypothetical protein INR49_025890 [Caranx melampygus]|nr:hypothetical protein INR49_025890 [Caranx melampygus]
MKIDSFFLIRLTDLLTNHFSSTVCECVCVCACVCVPLLLQQIEDIKSNYCVSVWAVHLFDEVRISVELKKTMSGVALSVSLALDGASELMCNFLCKASAVTPHRACRFGPARSSFPDLPNGSCGTGCRPRKVTGGVPADERRGSASLKSSGRLWDHHGCSRVEVSAELRLLTTY